MASSHFNLVVLVVVVACHFLAAWSHQLSTGSDATHLSVCPTTNGRWAKMEARPETHTRCAHAFCTFWRPTCMLSRWSLTKFLRRSSGGSLLRVRCWVGNIVIHGRHQRFSTKRGSRQGEQHFKCLIYYFPSISSIWSCQPIFPLLLFFSGMAFVVDKIS